MVWTAYFDESGTHDSPIMLMGGYLASDHQWARLVVYPRLGPIFR